MTLGVVHPGAMGASIASASRTESMWCAAGRSSATSVRAEQAGMVAIATLDELVERCNTIISVCPPAAALAIADAIADAGYTGVYADANAIAPATARTIDLRFERFVDGGIIGPPVQGTGSTRMYLAGADAEAVAAHWSGSDLDVRVIEGGPGTASALKLAFAAWTKGSAALQLAVRAVARAEGVEDNLLAEWAVSLPDLRARSDVTAVGTAAKAWRFVGEMDAIAEMFAAHGLPAGFHEAAGQVYARMSGLEDASEVDADVVYEALRKQSGGGTDDDVDGG